MWTNLYEKRMLYSAYSNRKVSAITISDATQSYANDVLPKTIKPHKLLNAIDWKRFFSEVSTKETIRLVMTGSLIDKKNQLLAIQTLEVLTQNGVDVTLDLIGDGKMRSELERYVEDNGLTKKVMFHGSINHPEEILKQASVYIHTAKSESFGLVLIEAMAAGLPVVCTDGGGNRDLIVEGENGFMVDTASAELLAEKTHYLIGDLEKRMEMGKKAQEFSKQFDIKNYVTKLLEFYLKELESVH